MCAVILMVLVKHRYFHTENALCMCYGFIILMLGLFIISLFHTFLVDVNIIRELIDIRENYKSINVLTICDVDFMIKICVYIK